MTAAIVGDDGRPGEALTVPTPKAEVWKACTDLLDAVAVGADIGRIGIACAGPVDTTEGIVAPINIEEWKDGFAIANAVQEQFPQASTSLATDGGCAALGEHKFGAAQGVDDVLSIVVSTGIGGGLVLQRQRRPRGPHRGAGIDDTVRVRRFGLRRDSVEWAVGRALGPGTRVDRHHRGRAGGGRSRWRGRAHHGPPAGRSARRRESRRHRRRFRAGRSAAVGSDPGVGGAPCASEVSRRTRDRTRQARGAGDVDRRGSPRGFGIAPSQFL